MSAILWIILAVLILLLIGAVLAVTLSKKKHKTDYYALFWMGLIWTLFGIY